MKVSAPSGPGTSRISKPACTSCPSLSIRYCSNCHNIAWGVRTMYAPPRRREPRAVRIDATRYARFLSDGAA